MAVCHYKIHRDSKLIFRLPDGPCLAPVVVEKWLDSRLVVARYDHELTFNCMAGAVMHSRDWKQETDPTLCIMLLQARVGKKGGDGKPPPHPVDELFLTKPPCTIATLHLQALQVADKAQPIVRYEADCTLRDTEGLKFGLVVEVAHKMLNGGVEPGVVVDNAIMTVGLAMPLSKHMKEEWDERMQEIEKRQTSRR